jgi:hypothetical protein
VPPQGRSAVKGRSLEIAMSTDGGSSCFQEEDISRVPYKWQGTPAVSLCCLYCWQNFRSEAVNVDDVNVDDVNVDDVNVDDVNVDDDTVDDVNVDDVNVDDVNVDDVNVDDVNVDDFNVDDVNVVDGSRRRVELICKRQAPRSYLGDVSPYRLWLVVVLLL